MSATLSHSSALSLPEGLRVWLTTRATSLDESNRDSDYVLPVLAAEGHYTPHPAANLAKVLAPPDFGAYETSGTIRHSEWTQRRIDFQPYPFASYTEELVRAIRQTKVEGDAKFLETLDPKFVAGDLVDDRFVRKAIDAVGGPAVFGLPANLSRSEIIQA